MKAKQGLLTGPKMTHSHSTVTLEASKVIEAAKECPHVTKIVLGQITPLGHAEPRLKFMPIMAGWKVNVRGGSSLQVLFLYTKNLPATQEYIQNEFDS